MYQPKGLRLDGPRFTEIAQLIGVEDAQFGKGPVVLPRAILAYRDAWHRYRALAKNLLEEHSVVDRERWQNVAEFIEDDVRTILIARSIRRAIEGLLKSNPERVEMVEAGFGTGFLAALALAMHPKVHLTGYDKQGAKVAVAQAVCTTLGLGENRFQFVQQEITPGLAASLHPGALMVAEHVSAGLMHELTTVIPRSFQIDRRWCIPYAVHPQLVLRFGEGGIHGTGNEIVLADRASPDEVTITVSVTLPPGGHSTLHVANGITWSGAHDASLPDICQRDIRAVRVDGFRNHLLRSTALHAVTDASQNRFWHIRNQAGTEASGILTVSYPVGFLVTHQAAPLVTVSGNPAIEVYQGPIDQRRFEEYVRGMKRGE